MLRSGCKTAFIKIKNPYNNLTINKLNILNKMAIK